MLASWIIPFFFSLYHLHSAVSLILWTYVQFIIFNFKLLMDFFHFLLFCRKLSFIHFKSVHFCDPVDCSPPGLSVHEIFQARILEWVAISSSTRSSQPRDRTRVSRIAGSCFTLWATREALYLLYDDYNSCFNVLFDNLNICLLHICIVLELLHICIVSTNSLFSKLKANLLKMTKSWFPRMLLFYSGREI